MKFVDKVLLRSVYFRRLSTEEDNPTWKQSYVVVTERALIVLEESAVFGSNFQIAIELKTLQLHTFSLNGGEPSRHEDKDRGQPSRLTQMYLAEANDSDILAELPAEQRYACVVLNSASGRHIHVAADSIEQLQKLTRAIECSRLIHKMLLDKGLLSSQQRPDLTSIYDWADRFVNKHMTSLTITCDLMKIYPWHIDYVYANLSDIDALIISSIDFDNQNIAQFDNIIKKFNRSQIRCLTISK